MSDENSFEEQKVVVDLTGEASESKYEKVLIDAGERVGKFHSFELIQIPKFNKPDEKQSKIIVQIKIEDKDKGDVEIPLFLTPIVTKAPEGSTKSNSTLFEVLKSLKLLEDFNNANSMANGFSYKQLKEWLENVLSGRVARVLVQTTKKAKEPYSKIGEVYGFKVEEKPNDAPVSTEKEVKDSEDGQ